jgi:predicted 3-demethylubiquinone-9 3-methyltransferase (glyoxalase superfamily)
LRWNESDPPGFDEVKAGSKSMRKITPFLWFDGKAEEAANFYTSIFKNSKIRDVRRYGDAGPGPKGSVMAVTFDLEGEEFIALNGGPQFTFSPAISFFVSCETQEEVDALWDKLMDGGRPNACGWLTDKLGLTWQIVPSVLGKLLQDPDAEKSANVMRAMLKMTKLDIEGLRKASRKGAGEKASTSASRPS